MQNFYREGARNTKDSDFRFPPVYLINFNSSCLNQFVIALLQSLRALRLIFYYSNESNDMTRERYEELASEVLEAALTVHKVMGPGLLEAVYQQCMMKELSMRNTSIEALVMVPLIYKG